MNAPPSQAEIVIVGGGIVGVSVAYHLAKLGRRDVVLDIEVSREFAQDRPHVRLVELEDDHELVASLPRNFPGAVFIVQHIASGFAKGFSQWLNSESSISVRLARERS